MVSRSVDVYLCGSATVNFTYMPSQKGQRFLVDQLLQEASKYFAMRKKESLQLFALCSGEWHRPKRVLRTDEEVPHGTALSFKRFFFDLEQEAKVITKDDGALTALYQEARCRVVTGDMSLSSENLAELQTLDDPHFPTPRQYLEFLIKNCPEEYNCVKVEGCVVQKGIDCSSMKVGSTVHLTLNESGLHIWSTDQILLCEWAWSDVKSWRAEEGIPLPKVDFEVRMESKAIQRLELSTVQPKYITDCAYALCNDILKKTGIAPPSHFVLPAGRPVNAVYDLLNGILKPQVASFNEI